MTEGSSRRGGSSAGPLVLAVIFLAVLGAGVGFSLGTLAKHQHNAAASQAATDQPDPTTSTRRDNGTGGGNGAGGGNGNGNGGGQNSKQRCTAHTESLANAGQLTQLLYLRTDKSEVWVCADSAGTLYYQGHIGQPGDPLVEGSTALFLTDVKRENGNGYVATNTDGQGQTTKYHVTATQLVKEFSNYQNPKPNQTEYAVA